MSAAHAKRESDPSILGYDPYLERRLRPLLAECQRRSIKIVSNQGWLDPTGAAAALASMAKEEGLAGLRIAAVVAKDLKPDIADLGLRFHETGQAVADYREDIVSAEAYLGASEIAQALAEGADVIITSRVSDASLFLGPLIHEYGWREDDWNNLAKGVAIGHLLECATQVTGGYFADPGYKDVPGLADLGHPIADVEADRTIITKPDSTGGIVSTATCKEQILYEVDDPSRYLNPDVVADFGSFRFEQEGPDRVAVIGGRGERRPETLKVLVGVREGHLSEEMVLYAGAGALERARLAEEVLRERLVEASLEADDLRFDYVGMNAVHREASPPAEHVPYEIAVRVAVRARSQAEVEKLTTAVDPMAVSGPAATGKWAPMGERVRPVVGLYSTFVSRDSVPTRIEYFES